MPKKSDKKPSRAELEQRIKELEKENLQLSRDAARTKPPARRVNLRKISGYISLSLASFLLVLSMFVFWLRGTLVNAQTWTNTTTRIVQEDSVRNDLAGYISSRLLDEVDIESVVAEALPPRAEPLAQPISSNIRTQAEHLTNQVLESEEFITLWRTVNREAHSAVVEVLSTAGEAAERGERSGLIVIDDQSIFLNLRPVLDEVKENLRSRGLEFIPEQSVLSDQDVTFEVAEIQNFGAWLLAFGVLNSIGYWLLAFAAAFAALGVWAVGISRAAFYFLSGLTIILSVILIQMTKLGGAAASGAGGAGPGIFSESSIFSIYNIVTEGVVFGLRILAALALLVLFFTYVTSSSRTAVKLRRSVQKFPDAYKDYKALTWLGRNSLLTSMLIGLVAFIILFTTTFSAIWQPTLLIAVFGLAIILVRSIQPGSNSGEE